MDFKRSMPRVGCSISCKIILNGSEFLDGFVADVSADGLSFTPSSGEFPEDFDWCEKYLFKIDMHNFSDIGQTIELIAEPKWKRGMIVGFKIYSIDLSNFKRWWFLIYTLFFPKKNKN